jgi:2-desacetyl-2-hydroxyethyl bacteriochlorophyllide A dehydrogenase
MKYIVCEKPGVLELKDKAAPLKSDGEALLRIERVGICGTDLHAYQGNQAFFTYPRILGHELAGTVLEIEENDQGLKVGDQVAILPYLACNQCPSCVEGKTNCCEHLQVLGVHVDGGMQQLINIPIPYLISANKLSLEEIALIEPLSIGRHALVRAGIQESACVVVIGCGPIGLGILKQAQLIGANVVALDVNEARLAFAGEQFGIENTFLVDDKTLERCRTCFNGSLATVVFDASGNKSAMETGHHYMRHGGTYVLVGLYKHGLNFMHPELHAKETTLLCSRNATREDFIAVMELLSSGLFPVSKYITHQIEMKEIMTSFDLWIKPKTHLIKALVKF